MSIWPARWARGHWAEDEALQRTRFPVGPRNTWSNLWYAAAGLMVLVSGPGGREPVVFAAALGVLCLGSGLYHAIKEPWANALDHVGMYAVFGSLATWAIGYGWVGDGLWLAMAVGGIVPAVVFSYLVKVNLDVMMGLLVLGASVPAFLWGTPALAGWGLGIYALGYGCWQLDRAKHPAVGLWGHALWHGLTGFATAMQFLARVP